MILALLLAFPVPAHAQTPNVAVAQTLARVEALVASQKSKDAREIAALDRKALGFSKDLAPYGWRAVPALAAAVKDAKRPQKVRFLAASYLGLLNDPAAFAPLEEALLDRGQDPSLRALAAQSLSGLGVSAATVRRALCAAVAQEDIPREALDDALVGLATLGCQETSALARIARAYGPRPDGRDLATVRHALAVLGRSKDVESGRTLLALTAYFPPRGEARGAAIEALDARRSDLAAWLKPETLPVVTEALRSESERIGTMLALVRAARALGPEAAPALARLISHPDAEVLAVAAEALAEFKYVSAMPALEAAVAGALSDPRFSPKDGRPDPAQLLARVEKSVELLRRAR
jgi:HEAT repeat protein